MPFFFGKCEDGVHRFKARYDTVAPEFLKTVSSFKTGDIKSCYEKRYVKDICVKCGKEIER